LSDGHGPGVSAGDYSTESSSQWISLKDEMESSGAHASTATATASSGVCTSCTGAGCGQCCSDACGSCCGTGVRRWNAGGLCGGWINVDYLLWHLSGYNTPPLVTTAPNGVIPNLGNPGVAVVFGNDEIDDDFSNGGRIRFGTWVDDTQSAGIEGHFFAIDQEIDRHGFAQSGPGALSLGRPFIEVAPNFPVGVAPGEAALLAAFEDPVLGVISNGRVDVVTSSNVYSAGVLARHFLAEEPGVRVDALGGFRFFRLDEGLSIESTSIAGPGSPFPIPIGFTRIVSDWFNTVNQFYGGEFGLNLERDFGDLFSVEVISKVALGNVYQRIDLEGTKVLAFPAGPVDVRPGGLLVQPSNTGTPLARGSFERDRFAVLPEVNINAGVQLTRQVRATMGWSMLYLSDVVRPGHQIDRAVNGNQLNNVPIVGEARPVLPFDSTDVWLYGVNFGIEGTY
jgi:hypothetical protein